MHHVFVTEVADRYGMAAAVILNNLFYWMKQNEANETNYYDGHYWTYNSKKGFSKIFTYLTEKQIRVALDTLKDEGLILTGNYNKVPYDRTLWYTVTEKGVGFFQNALAPEGQSIGPVGQMEKPYMANEKAPEGKPIPYINTYNKTTDNKTIVNNGDDGTSSSTHTKPIKHIYGEYKHVRLSDNEYSKLIKDKGEAETLSAIKLLDEYIEEKGYKSKNHNLALRRWVFDAVKEKEQKERKKQKSAGYDWDNL